LHAESERAPGGVVVNDDLGASKRNGSAVTAAGGRSEIWPSAGLAFKATVAAVPFNMFRRDSSVCFEMFASVAC
jgi:hypothetical protein